MSEINQRNLTFNNKDILEQQMSKLDSEFTHHYRSNPIAVCADGETNIKKCLKILDLMVNKLYAKFSESNLTKIKELDDQYTQDKKRFGKTKKENNHPKFIILQTEYANRKHQVIMNEFFKHNIYEHKRKIILSV